MVKVFITGGAGFIGSHLAEELSSLGHQVVIYDNLQTGRPDNLLKIPHLFIKGDIRDYDLLVSSMQDCDTVYHLAALTSVAESTVKMDEYISVNLMGILNVLRASRAHQVKKFIMSSSAAVYGDSGELPKKENMRPNPKSPYAITKIDGEYYCELFRDLYALPTVCARFFNVYGERQATDSPYSAAIPIFVSKAVSNGIVSIYGDGTQTRDLVYVKDVVKALILLTARGDGVYNVGSGRTIDINSLVQTIFRITRSGAGVQYVAERPGEIKHSYASIAKIAALGFQPDFPLEEGLRRTINYFLNKRNKLDLCTESERLS